MAVFVATPLSAQKLEEIRGCEIWHYSKATPEQVVVSKMPGGPGQPNAIVRLSPPTGWQWDFWKFVRDLTVWDPKTFDPADRGRYLWCFQGESGFLARITNVQRAPLTIRIRGADLLARVRPERLFAREELATCIVIRGDCTGPALLDPPPP